LTVEEGQLADRLAGTDGADVEAFDTDVSEAVDNDPPAVRPLTFSADDLAHRHAPRLGDRPSDALEVLG
jgi:hypothetical protein